MIGNKEQIANTQKDEYRNQREIHLNSLVGILIQGAKKVRS